MGQLLSKPEIDLIDVHKEYRNIECASPNQNTTQMYLSLYNKDPSRLSSPICKIDSDLNKTVDFYPSNIQQVKRILVSPCSGYLVLQTDHKVVIYDTGIKKSTVMFQFERCFVAVGRSAAFIQSAPTSIMEVDFETREAITHKIENLELCRVHSFCVSNDGMAIFASGSIVKSDSSMVLKYCKQSGKVEQFYKSKKFIQKLEISDSVSSLISGKLSGTISLYDTNDLRNKKNLRFAGTLLDIKLMSGDEEKLLACYEVGEDVAFVFWNIRQFINERVVRLAVNLANSEIEIMFAKMSTISIRTGKRIVFFNLDQPKYTPKERFDFDDNLITYGHEPIKFNALLPSLERKMRSEQYSYNPGNPLENVQPLIRSSNSSPKQAPRQPVHIKPEIDSRVFPEDPVDIQIDVESIEVCDSHSMDRFTSSMIRESNINLETLNRICLSCKMNLSDITFYPCKHSVVCHRCVKSMEPQCPVCEQHIKKRSIMLIDGPEFD
jgi:hypothetical protein